LVWLSIANDEEMVWMMKANRSVSAHQLCHLLTNWRAGATGPTYSRLASAITVLVLDGRLPLQCRLPSERDLAVALNLSRSTVTAGYDALRERGYLISLRGSGSWTALPRAHRTSVPTWATAPFGGRPEELFDLASAAPGAPALAVASAARDALGELGRYLDNDGYDPIGLSVLRERVAARYNRRGLPTTPDEILITSGALHGLDLLLRLLVNPGDQVLTDSPTYPTVLDTIRASRARLVPVGLNPDGWNVDLLASSLQQANPRLAYLIPDYHNPTGHVMDGADREAVVAAAGRTGTYLVVDESFVELGYGSEPLPSPVAAYDRSKLVITVGSLSKPFWGGLRIGWVRAPVDVVRRLAVVRAASDMASPVLEQLIGARLLELADEVLPARRAQFARQRDALAAALRREMPEWRFAVPSGGLALWVELDGPVSTALTVIAGQHGIRLAAGPRFGPDGTLDHYLRLPFTQPAELLEAAVTGLAAARAQLDTPTGQSLVVA
jgi:DNA-binding transcriptional MocR family regulator